MLKFTKCIKIQAKIILLATTSMNCNSRKNYLANT